MTPRCIICRSLFGWLLSVCLSLGHAARNTVKRAKGLRRKLRWRVWFLIYRDRALCKRMKSCLFLFCRPGHAIGQLIPQRLFEEDHA
jgi:hypothetical protein